MALIPKKVIERMSRISRFQSILKTAKDRDLNESDTVTIIADILADVFGYDKYHEVTSELAIKGTYCDLAMKIDGKFQFLLEAKAVGIELKPNHLKQAVDYGANQGIPWVILTNSIQWGLYRIRFEQPISYELICQFNFLDLNPRREEDQERLFTICREGIEKGAREEYQEKMQSLNRFVLGALLLNEECLGAIRKELRKLSPGIKVELEEIRKLLANDVIKRDVQEGDEASKAQARLKRLYGKIAKAKLASSPASFGEQPAEPIAAAPADAAEETAPIG